MEPKRFHNTRTGETIVQPRPIDEAIPYERSVLLVEYDKDGLITYANKHFRLMHGYSKDELVGYHHSLLYHPDIPQALIDHLWQTVESGNYWRGYLKNLRKDGRYFWSSAWVKPLYDGSGNITGYIASHKAPDPVVVHKIEANLQNCKELTPEHFNAFAVPSLEVDGDISVAS